MVGFANIAVHEMAHALGFAHFFRSRGRYEGFFLGSNAQREWNKLNTTLEYPPFDPKMDHWSAFCFKNELMLATYTEDEGNSRRPISRVTLATFEDIGYQVNYDCADDGILKIYATCNEQNHPVLTLNEKLHRWFMRHKRRLSP